MAGMNRWKTRERRLRLLHRHSEPVEECGASKRLILRQAQDGRGCSWRKTGRGFTLLELVVAVFLLALIGTTMVALIVHSVKGWSSGTSRANADSAAALAVHKLRQDVRVGSSASVVSGELRVAVPPLVTDAYGETHYDTSATGTTYRYYLSNGSLYRQIGGNAATVFARDISAVSFSVSGDIISITITGRNQVGMSQTERQCSARVVLRNFVSS